MSKPELRNRHHPDHKRGDSSEPGAHGDPRGAVYEEAPHTTDHKGTSSSSTSPLNHSTAKRTKSRGYSVSLSPPSFSLLVRPNAVA